MELSLDVRPVTVNEAVGGMRRPFLRSFGRTWVARRLAASAWPAFRAALLHGSGIAVATSHAQVAAEERNLRTLLAARWPTGRLTGAVRTAAQSAADAA